MTSWLMLFRIFGSIYTFTTSASSSYCVFCYIINCFHYSLSLKLAGWQLIKLRLGQRNRTSFRDTHIPYPSSAITPQPALLKCTISFPVIIPEIGCRNFKEITYKIINFLQIFTESYFIKSSSTAFLNNFPLSF